jgi:hypothetical protein
VISLERLFGSWWIALPPVYFSWVDRWPRHRTTLRCDWYTVISTRELRFRCVDDRGLVRIDLGLGQTHILAYVSPDTVVAIGDWISDRGWL